MNGFEQAYAYLPPPLQSALRQQPLRVREQAQEIRLRVGAPLGVSLPAGEVPLACICTAEQVQTCFWRLCGQSVHTHQQELRQGFVTTADGLRAGLAGTAVVENGEVVSLREITSICLRVARRHDGCAESLIKQLLVDGVMSSLLLCGPPASGKTSLLRDMARLLSEQEGQRVTVVDERGEIAMGGLPRCDILRGHPKAIGIRQAVRCLAPDVVIFDELGDEREMAAVRQSLQSGVAVIATVHATDRRQLASRPGLEAAVRGGCFSRLVWMKGRSAPGQIDRIEKVGDGLENQRIAADSGGGNGTGTLCGGTTAAPRFAARRYGTADGILADAAALYRGAGG